jgi:serine/threonine protein kinase
MHCPKCKQSFEEGSRRFCPTDGARLVSDLSSPAQAQTGSVFATLIPKMSGIEDLGARFSEAKGVFVAGGESIGEETAAPVNEIDDIFFEIEDAAGSEADTKLLFEHDRGQEKLSAREIIQAELPSSSSPAKKIELANVPAGGIDLGSGYNGADLDSNFDVDSPDKLIGTLVKGRYQVTEFLGADETGLAYLADDRILEGKTVLVRVYVDGEIDQMLQSILAEERISLSHFSHPNIARFVDSGEFVNGVPFIISEYVDGLSVADVLSIHGQMDLKRAARIIRQISGALNEAHQEGILHRDIRPENFIIDPDSGESEQAKLVNFGASGGEPNGDNLVYKSPEVIDGRINTIVSDIFSLGVVAFEMLTGRLPFDGESKTEILRAQYAGPSALPSSLRPELPASVNVILMKALAFKPAERFKKAREFGDALSSALTETPADARPVSNITEIRPNITELKPIIANTKTEAEAERPSSRIQMSPLKRPDPQIPGEAERPAAVPPVKGRRPTMLYAAAAIGALLVLGTVFGWYYFSGASNSLPEAGITNNNLGAGLENAPSREANNIPLPRAVVEPPNTQSFTNTKDNLKGDLASNYLGFSLYFPKDWKVIGPQPGTSASARGKFLDISKSTPEGKLREQMLISYYPSAGTFEQDSNRFPKLVGETNATLHKILPGYEKVSEGPVTLGGGLRAYEVKFKGGGTSPNGEKLVVWGRRLFVPAAHAQATNGFEITMLATSHADNVRGADEVGVRGELGPILQSFEPSPNF